MARQVLLIMGLSTRGSTTAEVVWKGEMVTHFWIKNFGPFMAQFVNFVYNNYAASEFPSLHSAQLLLTVPPAECGWCTSLTTDVSFLHGL